MKKTILLLSILFGCIQFSYTQDSTNIERPDIIYLKNGKVIKGKVVKRQFGTVSVKVTDSISQKENVIIYQQDDIKKIEGGYSPKIEEGQLETCIEGLSSNKKRNRKQTGAGGSADSPSNATQSLVLEQSPHENILRQVQQPGGNISMPVIVDQPVIVDGAKSANSDDYFDPFSVPRPKRRERIWNREIRGFRIFLDYAYIQGLGSDKNHRFEWATSIGFQFNPIFYVGVGSAYDLTLNNKDSSLPVFLNPRINFLDENTTPFWDVKVGYSVAMGKGFYFSTSLGVSMSKKGKGAWNLGLVYSLQNAKYYDWSEKEPRERIAIKPKYHGLALKLAYEFGVGR